MTTSRIRIALVASTALILASCGGDTGGTAANPGITSVTAVATPTPTPSATSVTAASYNVTPCFNQKVAGRTVASLVVPDVITLDMTGTSGFPNGRKLLDPVIDLELAVLFLDLNKHPADVLARIPLNPSGNDVPLPAGFPYLGDAHGGVPAAAGGAGFVFRADVATAYTRVDRMGEPAVATALVRSASKTAFNDDSPTQDATGKWVPEFAADLGELTAALQDDFAAAGLTICATKN